MTIAQFQTAFYNWVKSIVGNDVTVVWADQPKSAPRPQPPYIMLRITSGPRKLGDDALTQTAPGVYSLDGIRMFSVSVNAMGSGALQIISDIQSSVDKPTVQEALQAAGIAINDYSDVRNLSALLETGFESRAQMDVTASTVMSSTDAPGYIGSVEFTGPEAGDTQTITIP